MLGALGSMNNADLEKESNVYYLSEITTLTSNLINTVLILIDLQIDPPKRLQSSAGALF